ncbi:MFS transporter [Novosphingobium pokkalii]
MTSLTHFATLGVFLPAIEAETGWSRSGLSFGMLLFSIETIVAAPFVGMLVDRFGPRRIGIPGLALYLAAVALLRRTGPSIWTWWAAWMLLGIGGSLAMFNVWTTAISRHFDSARGMAMGIALAGPSMAAIVMPLLATAALHYADWRTGYAVIALVQALITFPLFCAGSPMAMRLKPPRPRLRAALPPRCSSPGCSRASPCFAWLPSCRSVR